MRPIEEFARGVGVPIPEYTHVLENDYSLLKSHGNNNNSGFASIKPSGCDCAIPTHEELCAGQLACGLGCINRTVYMECGPLCPAYTVCSNRRFQLRLYAPTEPFYCGPEKGWGLRALEDIPK